MRTRLGSGILPLHCIPLVIAGHENSPGSKDREINRLRLLMGGSAESLAKKSSAIVFSIFRLLCRGRLPKVGTNNLPPCSCPHFTDEETGTPFQ